MTQQPFASPFEIFKRPTPAEAERLLERLRPQYEAPNALGPQQLEAHLTLAWHADCKLTGWEVYESPRLHLVPRTDFYNANRNEIIAEIEKADLHALVMDAARSKLVLKERLSDAERKAHYAYAGPLAFLDAAQWKRIDLPYIQWFDMRDMYRERLTQGPDAMATRAKAHLERLRLKADSDPTPRRIEEYERHRKYVEGGRLEDGLKKQKANLHLLIGYLEKVEASIDLRKTLVALLRSAENAVRRSHNVPAVGEGWISETQLFYRLCKLFPGELVEQHAQPAWLKRQHLDVFFPDRHIAIEYQGVQHFQSIEFFGGEEAFRQTVERDARKAELCRANSVTLRLVHHDHNYDDAALKALIEHS